ncbi:T9SS type A sorting domain-containing protein [Aequorivita echinoideorum]|uniref:T9SS type A sorting domain-containing protein n=1 Tax=Aequorivita echinoideorum TaxID=1549647 RepID=A0ABS5S0Z2_9FLAO|nr:T9SS type A sorting domain-containing protein [Aequorivita echinoideorum]MBT0606648.1 T9SS type A sorting domain-containing protein [Aequorivita echinoideorum]
MKKITTEKLSTKLLKYGALSAAALGVADASGQIVYTDLDPDQVLNVGDAFIVDMTGMGTTGFEVNNPAGLANGNAAIVTPSSGNPGGAFVGSTVTPYNYPALLAEGNLINASAGFTMDGQRGDLNYYGCAYSNSQWCDTVTDGYLGVKFTFNGNTHYGWIRMDTDVSGSNLITVKDFAYESTPNTAIAAGDMGVIAGVSDNNFQGFKHFVANNQLNLSANTAMEKVALHNLLGQEVISQKLSSTSEVINLSSLQAGVYLATITIDGASKTVKIAVN